MKSIEVVAWAPGKRYTTCEPETGGASGTVQVAESQPTGPAVVLYAYSTQAHSMVGGNRSERPESLGPWLFA